MARKASNGSVHTGLAMRGEGHEEVLMVLTSDDKLGATGEKTGFWLDEFAAPYYVLKDARVEVTLASPKAGEPPC
jgi:putative intracellular protease/amidase